ncbi:MAG: hypothetical protein VYB35_11315 [Verrucomicrobiota bacterium]|nr:hypothetical protein [Verrucomicrobiota bacterium]
MRTEKKPAYDPIRLVKFEAKLVDSNLNVNWETDDQTLPQFEYKLRLIMGGQDGKGSEIRSYSEVKPHARSAVMTLDRPLPKGEIIVEILCSDILGNKVKRFHPVQR